MNESARLPESVSKWMDPFVLCAVVLGVYAVVSPLAVSTLTLSGGGNYAYGDGHAKYAERTAIKFKNFGISSDVYSYGPTGGTVPNTTGLTDVKNNPNYWYTWGNCDLSAIN